MAAERKANQQRGRVKLSTTVDRDLLAVVDRFMEQHGQTDRGAVVDEALRLWAARERERALEVQHLAPRSPEEQEEYAAWRRIRRAAAGRLLRERE
jgi:hypothetical protein